MIGISQFPLIHQLASHTASGNFSMLMTPLEISFQNAILRVVFNVCSHGFLHSSDLDILGDAWNGVCQHITPPEWSGSLLQNVNPEPEGSSSKRAGSEKSRVMAVMAVMARRSRGRRMMSDVMTSSPQGPNHRIWAQPGRPGPSATS